MLKKILSFLSMVLLGGALGVLAVHIFETKEVFDPSMHWGIKLALVGITILVTFFLQIIIHEAGHLVCGLLSGYSFVSFRIGSIVLVKYEKEGYKIKKMSLAGTGGQCLLNPPGEFEQDFPYILYNLGGGLFNIIASLIATIGIIFLKGLIVLFLFIFSVWGIFFGLSNLIPLSNELIANDGKNIQILNSSKTARNALWLQLRINYLLTNGTRLKDMPEKYLELEGDDLISKWVQYAKLLRYIDMHDFDSFLENYKSSENMLGILKIFLQMEELFIDLLRKGPGADDSILQDKTIKQTIKSMSNYITFIRIKYAYEALKENNLTQETKERFEKACETYPSKAGVESEKELVALVDKKVEEFA